MDCIRASSFIYGAEVLGVRGIAAAIDRILKMPYQRGNVDPITVALTHRTLAPIESTIGARYTILLDIPQYAERLVFD